MKYALWVVIIIAVIAGGVYAYTTFAPGSETPTENSGDIVQAQDVTVGDGTEATPGDIVSVLYVGKLEDGTVFDSSEAHGNQPLTFQLGAPGIIAGFQVGVNTMRVGGERLIAIPPSFGYGAEDVTDAEGNVIIPGNSTLIFEIRLIDVQPAPAEGENASGTPATEAQ